MSLTEFSNLCLCIYTPCANKKWESFLKDAMPEYFRSELFTSYILTIYAVKHTPVNMRNCQIMLSMHVKILK